MSPTKEQATQFALMTMAGCPAEDALRYFIPEDAVVDSLSLAQWAKAWPRHRLVMAAMVELQGGDWAALNPQARIQLALEKHYNEMAYYLYSHNYAAITHPNEKNKADTCRAALEIKAAGLSGKMDALSAFWSDLMKSEGAKKPPLTMGHA